MGARRKIVLALGASALVAPLFLFAQQSAKVWRIGSISLSSGRYERTEAFVQGLRELGYLEGKNLIIEWRWAAWDVSRLTQIASELVGLKVDLILVGANNIAEAARSITQSIPIVDPTTADPVGSGFAKSLARPGGNMTGFSVMTPELAGKKLQLLRELVPTLKRVAVLVPQLGRSGEFATGARALLDALTDPAKRLGIDLFPQAAGNASEIPKAFAAMRRDKAQALVVQATPVTIDARKLIVDLCSQQYLPAIYDSNTYVEAGGLISYGPDWNELFRRSAGLVDKIFRGAHPGEIPFEQPNKFDFSVNLKTAKALGIMIPQSILLQATSVIE